MGLSLCVGILADLKENDKEGAGWFREDFALLNQFLASEGLPSHEEPEDCEVWSTSLLGYSGLHCLRRIAAYLDLMEKLPPPLNPDGDPTSDPTLIRYYEMAGRDLIAYPHLVNHSDAEGFYLPMDFLEVLVPGDDHIIPGPLVGSAHRLLAECEKLAAALELPTDIDPESDEVVEAIEGASATTGWKKYGLESAIC